MGILTEKGFDLEIVKGEVLSSTVRVESDVSGRINISGSGSVQVNGTTYAPGYTTGGGEIKTKHTRIQDIYIKVDDSNERHFTTRNFVVPCREGHELAFVVLKKRGDSLPILARIKNTSEQIFDWGRVFDRLLPIHKIIPATLYIIIALFGAFIGLSTRSFGLFLIVLVVGIVVTLLGYRAISNHYHNRFTEDESWKQALQEVKHSQS